MSEMRPSFRLGFLRLGLRFAFRFTDANFLVGGRFGGAVILLLRQTLP